MHWEQLFPFMCTNVCITDKVLYAQNKAPYECVHEWVNLAWSVKCFKRSIREVLYKYIPFTLSVFVCRNHSFSLALIKLDFPFANKVESLHNKQKLWPSEQSERCYVHSIFCTHSSGFKESTDPKLTVAAKIHRLSPPISGQIRLHFLAASEEAFETGLQTI